MCELGRIGVATGIALAVQLSALTASAQDASAPDIVFTYVPPPGSFDNLRGKVLGVTDPTEIHIATYVFLEGSGWFTKPYATTCSPVLPDGTFEVDITTGGCDEFTQRIAAFLLPIDEPCPDPVPNDVLPELPTALASELVERYPEISFSGFEWFVKHSGICRVAPGDYPRTNFFSEVNVWVSTEGLHLALRKNLDVNPARWEAAEVLLDRSLGYGEYVAHITTDRIDDCAVFGAFTWDNDAPEVDHREMDFEISRFCNGSDGNDAQFVRQPPVPGNVFRFPIGLHSGEPMELTYIMDWRPEDVKFSLYAGHHFDTPPASDLIETWTRTDPFDPGTERFRLNFWLFSPDGPVDGEDGEILIPYFDYRAPEVCDVELDFADGALQMSFTLGLSEAATWSVRLFALDAVLPLWSLRLDPFGAPVTLPVSVPGFPQLHEIAVVSTLSSASRGVRCIDSATVDTGGSLSQPTALK